MKSSKKEAVKWWEIARMAEDYVGTPEQALKEIYEHARDLAEFWESMDECSEGDKK